MYASKTLTSVSLILIINVTLSQAMLPPPMLRAVCGAFADAEEAVGNQAMAAGKAAVDMAMKPIAIVGGLKAAAVGTGMKIGGGAIKFVGEKMAKDGGAIETAGAGVKGAGLGVAALGVKPLAEKVVAAGTVAEGAIDKASAGAKELMSKVGDTSIQIDATLDSPFLGHHHKEVAMTAGLDTAMHQSGIQQQQEQTTKSKRASKIDPELAKSVLTLMKEHKLEDCVYKAICELNCNPQGFGQDGKQVFMNMVRLQGSNVLDKDESKSFHEAASNGRKLSGKCDQCANTYSSCSSKSSDLIKMASNIRLD